MSAGLNSSHEASKEEDADVEAATRARKQPPNDVQQGRLWLLLVALLWGTYTPTLRFLYSMSGPPTPSALLLVRTLLGAATLLVVDKWTNRRQRHAIPPAPSPAGAPPPPSAPSGGNPVERALNFTSGAVWLAGLELGLTKFAGEAFQAVGLENTTAIRGAFLIQATSLLTPLVASLAGDQLSAQVVAGALLALAGTCLMTLLRAGGGDGGATAASSSLLYGGDVAVLLAACFYSLSTVRLSKYASRFPPVRLATWKTLSSSLVAAGWLASDLAARSEGVGVDLASLWPGWNSPAAWAATLWLALGPGALATYAQLKGQSSVPAGQAQVLYATVPVWTAVLALLFLSGETVGLAEWVGGALIVSASILASRSSKANKKTS